MKNNFATTSFLFLLCMGTGLLSLGFGSCEGSSYSGGPQSLTDSGARDSGATHDSAALPDTGAAFDASAPADTSAPDAGDDAGWCGMPQTSLGATCDDCVATNCETTWCACIADPVVVGDAGSGCQSYVQCVESCVAADAGSPSSCLASVCAVPPFTASEQQEGHSFLDCLVQYCGSQCGQ
jgi:hypothetical protein